MASKLIRYLITLLLLAAALWIGKAVWDRYMESPWTRDGRIKADVINISADVSGTVTAVLVRDNQLVQKGDVLFTVDQARYDTALLQAEALLAAQRTEKGRRSKEAGRRSDLDASVVSTESRETAEFAVSAANSQYRAALASRDLARLNLERTAVRAPVTGYVTNLNVHTGDFAAVGAPKLAVIDNASYYVVGYFEETKLPLLAPNDKVDMSLMGGGKLQGHIESIARGITDRDANTGRELLADVNPSFNWVRLAQRVPVRIHIDQLPQDRLLVAGTTCTVVVRARSAPAGKP
ncbi:efflux RND transporter periplasmic adaptor subunit [Janthinobacterium agaricidamnosum]|uniref:HlyD secretion family protein n=1 Tax=Janthinobacterium agaricidamnosum NBRC 102515 = DSM 9628 TaxID=1349767 RepID=W0VBD0_9BURK|nr:efflux RND transporter periplasmic adaptor subunit [Janthinobacterium agaricidamnosum]CDG84663.1 hlyD secretion family protein [Janthinobacterium agaricidamnosum NBRC 102515 = DSM 9628]